MLVARQTLGEDLQEVNMSTITTYPFVDAEMGIRLERAGEQNEERSGLRSGPVHRESQDSQDSAVRHSEAEHDQEMMFAWSIGTTELAVNMPQSRREECAAPPEVYIG